MWLGKGKWKCCLLLPCSGLFQGHQQKRNLPDFQGLDSYFDIYLHLYSDLRILMFPLSTSCLGSVVLCVPLWFWDVLGGSGTNYSAAGQSRPVHWQQSMGHDAQIFCQSQVKPAETEEKQTNTGCKQNNGQASKFVVWF